MAQGHDHTFTAERHTAFTQLTAAIETRMSATAVTILTDLNELSPDAIHRAGLRESWSLLLNGIRHLHNGAPRQAPGLMTEALSRASLRSSALASALGIRPPRFEQMYFIVDYTTGREAAHALCRRFVTALIEDLPASRRIIHKKILEGPTNDALPICTTGRDVETLKKQIGLSFTLLSEAYAQTCDELRQMFKA